MLSHCMCRNFHDQEDNEDYPWSSSTSSPNRSPSPSSTPKKSASSSPKRSKISNFCNRHKNKSKNDKNPYSSRGLDKFTLLLADLEDKRIKILDEIAATTTEDIPLIRFGYSNSKGNLVPIIIRLKNQQKKKQETKLHIDGNDKIVEITEAVINRKPKAGLSVPKRQIQRTNTAKLGASPLSSPEAVKKIQKKSLLDKSKSHICKYYFGIVIVLILLCLAIYGRSFAIICMSVCWYLMPVVDKNLNSRSMMKKNNYTDEEKKMGIDGFPCSFKIKNISRSTTLDNLLSC
ncbi:uncharacterized protein LOC113328741 [Papaver somniferum]|uniref:uncharacterized protein LOC113328741 n=1 Tax=Papaver somniferum TaxID=3469 RepID=UPI000E6F771B|nr:uncharacterized protein LOC113328741 [Papaver somniferum]